jgi:hypothetical protein
MINLAGRELIAFAAAARGPEWASDLDGALTAARSAGWEWPRAGWFACRLIFTEDASPRDLLEAARDPLNAPRGAGPPPTGLAEQLDAVRAKARAASESRRARPDPGPPAPPEAPAGRAGAA